MTEPHFHEEQVVRRARPVRTQRVVSERRVPRVTRVGGLEPAAAVLAGALVILIVVLILAFLV